MLMRRQARWVPGLIAAVALSGCAAIGVSAIGDELGGGATAGSDTMTTGAVVEERLAPALEDVAAIQPPDGAVRQSPIGAPDVVLARDGIEESADRLEKASDPLPVSSAESEEPAADAHPLRVRIPDIGVDAEIIDLGLNPDGTLEVPQVAEQSGWYTGRSVPGNVGPSVVVGHVAWAGGPPVFARLSDLRAGQTIEIERSDGLIALFRVSESTLVLKDEFPTEQVYGPTARPTLRLVTCGGEFDRSVRSHKSNLIVFAEHLGNREPVLSPQQG